MVITKIGRRIGALPSTPAANHYAWVQNFDDGYQFNDNKDINWLGVRAVRAFINSPIQPFNNLPKPQVRQAVERFIHDAEDIGEVDITKLQERLQGVPDAESILTILNWLKTKRTIKTLNFTNIDLSEFIEPLCDLLAARTDFTTINFTNCNLNGATVRRLLQNCRGLTNLYLGWNNIGDSEEDVGMLAEVWQRNPALTVLDLRANRIGARGAAVLASVLQNNPTLTTLNLENNLIGNDEVEALAEALRSNVRLTALYLGWNIINHNGVGSLLEVLQNKPSLIAYDLHNNSINDKVRSKLNKIYSEKILLRLLRKIKRASSFTFALGNRCMGNLVVANILEYAGLNVHNRAAFIEVRDYDTAENRRVIFSGSLEEVIRLFYYGNLW